MDSGAHRSNIRAPFLVRRRLSYIAGLASRDMIRFATFVAASGASYKVVVKLLEKIAHRENEVRGRLPCYNNNNYLVRSLRPADGGFQLQEDLRLVSPLLLMIPIADAAFYCT